MNFTCFFMRGPFSQPARNRFPECQPARFTPTGKIAAFTGFSAQPGATDAGRKPELCLLVGSKDLQKDRAEYRGRESLQPQLQLRKVTGIAGR